MKTITFTSQAAFSASLTAGVQAAGLLPNGIPLVYDGIFAYANTQAVSAVRAKIPAVCVFGNSISQLDQNIGVPASTNDIKRGSLMWLKALANGGFRHCKAAPMSSGYAGAATSDKNGIYGYSGASFANNASPYMLQDLALFLEQLRETPDIFYFKDIWQNDLGGHVNGITSLAQLQNACIQAIRTVKAKFPNVIILFAGPGANSGYASSPNPTLSATYYAALKTWMSTEFTSNDSIQKNVFYVQNDCILQVGTAGVPIANTTVDGVHYNMRGAALRGLFDWNEIGWLFPNRLEIPLTPWASGQPLTYGGNPDFSVISTNTTQGSTAASVTASGITLNTVSGNNVHFDTWFYNSSTNKQVTVNWADTVNLKATDLSQTNGIIVTTTSNSSWSNSVGLQLGGSTNCQIGQQYLAPYSGGIYIPAKLTTPLTFAVRLKLINSANLYGLGLFLSYGQSSGSGSGVMRSTAYFPEEDATYYEYINNPAGISGVFPAGTELTLIIPSALNNVAVNTVVREAFLSYELISGATNSNPVQIQIESMGVFQEDIFQGSVVLNPSTTVPYINETKNSQQVIVAPNGATISALTLNASGTAITLATTFAGPIMLAQGDSIVYTFSAGTPSFTITNIV